MKEISELKQLFDEINKLKSKATLNTSHFCSELTKSDDDEYLELHFSLLEQKKKYFQADLKMFFGFRQNKEKTYYFLKDKLKIITDEPFKIDVEEIIKDLKFYTLEEYKEWINNIKVGKRKDKNEFVWAIMKSPYIEFHYQLLNDKELDEEFKQHLRNRFEEHKAKAETFLISKLENNEDLDFQCEIIFMLGCVAQKQKDKALIYAKRLAESINDYTRDRALIVLGWIGTIEDSDILERHLLNDTNSKCRAWSASSFMQMWFRRKSDKLKILTFKNFQKALEKETDYFVLATIIDAIRELGKTKLDISQKALDNLEIGKIDIAKIKAIKYLKEVTK